MPWDVKVKSTERQEVWRALPLRIVNWSGYIFIANSVWTSAQISIWRWSSFRYDWLWSDPDQIISCTSYRQASRVSEKFPRTELPTYMFPYRAQNTRWYLGRRGGGGECKSMNKGIDREVERPKATASPVNRVRKNLDESLRSLFWIFLDYFLGHRSLYISFV